MNRVNILFYSNKCKTCYNLIRLLQNQGIIKNFKLFCVDDNKKSLPPFVTIVPTMVVNEINKPLVGQETFKYVNTVKMMNEKNWVDNNHKLTMQNIMMNNQKKDYIGYDTNEMSGFSDNFAYTKTDNAQPHSYVKLDNKNSSIFTAPKDNKKLSKEEQNKAIKNIQEKRDSQDVFYKNEMEKDQQHKVYINKLKNNIPDNTQNQIEEKKQSKFNNQNQQQMNFQNQNQNSINRLQYSQQLLNNQKINQMKNNINNIRKMNNIK